MAMKKLIYAFLFSAIAMGAQAQMTAMDFNRNDCNGNAHHLFAELDSGYAVILEYFMLNCSPCVTAGNKLEAMKNDLLAEFPGMVKSYSIGFTNAYSCPNIAAWVTNNGFSSYPLDSGTASVAYYGGFGMPTVVILGGGTAHTVLGNPYIGFSTSDTTLMAADIRDFLSTATARPEPVATEMTLSPQPADANLRVSLQLPQAGHLRLELLDLSGRSLQVVHDADVAGGAIQVELATLSLPAGMYLMRMDLDGSKTAERFVVMH